MLLVFKMSVGLNVFMYEQCRLLMTSWTPYSPKSIFIGMVIQHYSNNICVAEYSLNLAQIHVQLQGQVHCFADYHFKNVIPGVIPSLTLRRRPAGPETPVVMEMSEVIFFKEMACLRSTLLLPVLRNKTINHHHHNHRMLKLILGI